MRVATKAARRAIGDSGRAQSLIRTVRGRGYQFVGDVKDDRRGQQPSNQRDQDEAGGRAEAAGLPRVGAAALRAAHRERETHRPAARGRRWGDAVRLQVTTGSQTLLADVTPAAVADLAVSRAGGSTCAELTTCGVPSVLMPYPFHKDLHQRANAQVLAGANAAVLLDDEQEVALAGCRGDVDRRVEAAERRADAEPPARVVSFEQAQQAVGRRHPGAANLDLADIEIVDAPDSAAAAARAVQLVREGKAEVLMKGSLHTDELLSYQGLSKHFVHNVINHAEQYVDGNVHTNGMENFWSLFKRCIKGTHVSVEPFHLFRYLDEQSFRYNERKDCDSGRFRTVVSQVTGKRITYKELIADAAVRRHVDSGADVRLAADRVDHAPELRPLPAQDLLLELAALKPGEHVLETASGTGLVTFRAADAVGALAGSAGRPEIVVFAHPLDALGRDLLPGSRPAAPADLDDRHAADHILDFVNEVTMSEAPRHE